MAAISLFIYNKYIMSQILKFQSGGSTDKYGTLTLNGKAYKMNDSRIQSLYEQTKSLHPKTQYQFNFIINALKSGEDLDYHSNELFGNVKFDINDRGQERVDKKHAVGIGKEKHVRQAISALNDIILEDDVQESSSKKLAFDNRNIEWAKDEFGNYITDDSGNRSFINSANNLEIMDFWRKMKEYSDSEEDFSISGLSNRDSNFVRNYFKNTDASFYDTMWEDIKTGKNLDQYSDILDDFNIFINPQVTKEKDEIDAETQKELTSVYDSKKMNKDNPHIVYDSTTKSFKFTDPNIQKELTSLGNVWLNDSFIKKNPNWAPLIKGYDDGLFIINGELYSANDPQLLKNSVFKSFVEDNKKTHGQNNKIIIQNWDDITNPYRPYNYYNGVKYAVPGWEFGDLSIQDITNHYTNHDYSAILRYMDPNNTEYNAFGLAPSNAYKYLIYNGKQWLTKDAIDDLTKSDSISNNYHPSYLVAFKSGPKGEQLIPIGEGVAYEPATDLIWTIEKDGTYTKKPRIKKNTNNYKEVYDPINNTSHLESDIFYKDGGVLKFEEGGKPWWERAWETLMDTMSTSSGNSSQRTAIPTTSSSSLPTSDSTLTSSTFADQERARMLYNAKKAVSSTTTSGGTSKYDLPKLRIMGSSSNPYYTKSTGTLRDPFGDFNKKTSNTPKSSTQDNKSGQKGSSSNKRGSSWYTDPEGLLNTAAALGSLQDIANANRKANDRLDKLANLLYHQKTPLLPRILNIAPINRSYEESIKQLRLTGGNTSDVRLNSQTQSDIMTKQFAANRDYYDKLSQEVNNNYNTVYSEQQNKIVNDINVENQDKDRLLNFGLGRLRQDQVAWEAIGQTKNNYNDYLGDRLAQSREEQINKKNSIKNYKAELKYQDAVRNEFESLGGLKRLSAEDREILKNTGNYVAALEKIAPGRLSKLRSKILSDLEYEYLNNYDYNFSPIGVGYRPRYAKKGTKLNVTDKLLLEQNKSTRRELIELNKDVIKLFMKITK